MKIAFIVEYQFSQIHIGVRNYFLALATLLEKYADVDFLTYRIPYANQIHWSRVWIPNQIQRQYAGISQDVVFKGHPSSVYQQYIDFVDNQNNNSGTIDVHFFDTGKSINFNDYELVIITNPWLVVFNDRLSQSRIIGIAYDTVPNVYTITNLNKPFGFANLHRIGFDYYRNHCDYTLAISQKTADDLQKYFSFTHDQIRVLPPIIPSAYRNYQYQSRKKEYQVILASPFDPRKGLARMPKLIHGAIDHIQSLAIYGNIRCSEELVRNFFMNLPKNLMITWYLQATTPSVQNLFESSEVLLFPSTEEGLGLPVIEAQLCGTRVVASDIDPLNQLALAGNFLLTGDDIQDIEILKNALKSPQITSNQLAHDASKIYSYRVTEATILSCLGIPVKNPSS